MCLLHNIMYAHVRGIVSVLASIYYDTVLCRLMSNREGRLGGRSFTQGILKIRA